MRILSLCCSVYSTVQMNDIIFINLHSMINIRVLWIPAVLALMAYEMRRIIYNTITLDYANWDEDTEETAY